MPPEEAPVLVGRARPRVLLTTEGTYPHYTGGVSSWCDRLLHGAEDVDFVVWALMMNPFIKRQFAFPSNVVGFVEVPLWGVEQPAEYTREIPSAHVFRSSRRTKEADIQRNFIPLFSRFLDQTTAALFDPNEFASALADMHMYFRDFEYRRTWRSRAVWEVFKARLVQSSGAPIEYPDVVFDDEEEAPLPTLTEMKDSFMYLVKGDERRPVAGSEHDDVPLVGEAIEGLRWLYRLLQTINVEVPESDVTHSAAAAFCAVPCILAKVERSTPFLLTEHGVYLREQYLNIERRRYPYNLKRFLIDFVSAIAQTSYHLADQVSPVCAFNARWESAYGAPQERIRVIYNGVDENTYAPVAGQQSARDPSKRVVIQVGRIDPLKDQHTLMFVADLVRREMPGVQFHHYGPIADDEYAKEIFDLHKELGLQDTVIFKGETNEVAEAYASADISLMTSISEAFPFGVVESLMCATPVVSTNVGGVPEALGDTGLTAPARDAEALSQAVLSMLQLPEVELKELGTRARERALEHFTLAQFIDEYQHSYFDLVQNRTEYTPDVPAFAPMGAEFDGEETPSVADEYATFGDAEEEAPLAPFVEPEEEIAAAEHAEPMTLAELDEGLRSDDPFVRTGALARVQPQRGLSDVVEPALTDAYPHVRREAVKLLARTGDATAQEMLTRVAASDPAPEIRREAIAALGRFVAATETDEGVGA